MLIYVEGLINIKSFIVVDIWLGRKLLSPITTVYTPTVLLNIIGHITHYFKPFFFESALAVNLTVMLVLTSMLISVVESLPQTAYIKMVELWLIFNLLLPFTDVLLHTTIDFLRYGYDSSEQFHRVYDFLDLIWKKRGLLTNMDIKSM